MKSLYEVLSDEIENTENDTPPEKGWRNLWFRITDGRIMPGPVLWTTKEIAEFEARNGTLLRLPGVFEYLGAFEESS